MQTDTPTITEHTEINDIRKPSEFKSNTFSNFKKTEVKTQLIENIKSGKIEPACYWCAELVCSGHFTELWDIIIHYLSKHIHLGNPKLPIYVERRYVIFKNIIQQHHFINEIDIRNNPNIRKLFAETICMLILSSKKPSFEQVKINRIEEYDITQIGEKLMAPSTNYIDDIFRPKDPEELFIPLNEFAYNISRDKMNMATACYWFEWMVEFETICKKKNAQCCCVRRPEYNVEKKLQTDVIFIIWDCIIHYSNLSNNKFISSIIDSLVNLFCIRYTNASSKKRRYVIYYAIALLTEHVPVNVELITDKTKVQSVVENINHIYKQVKKNECSPNTQYLYSNLEHENNFQETLKRMEAINSLLG